MRDLERIVITGLGLTAPNGNSLAEFRHNLLHGISGVTSIETRFMGRVLAGVCNFDEFRYQSKKERRRGTRAGSISIFSAHEALESAGLGGSDVDPARVGTFIGITEHGTVETENEIDVTRQYDYDTKFWSHHHNPRTVANNPAGEVTVNLGFRGPHYTIGAACAAGTIDHGRRRRAGANALLNAGVRGWSLMLRDAGANRSMARRSRNSS